MTLKRLLAIILIFISVTLAWVILGSVTLYRTSESDKKITKQVRTLHGGNQVIEMASLQNRYREGTNTSYKYKGREFSSVKVDIDIVLAESKKGLVYFPTYKLKVKRVYKFDVNSPQTVYFSAGLGEDNNAMYKNVEFKINGVEQDNLLPLINGERISIYAENLKDNEIEISYDTTGMQSFEYQFAGNNSYDPDKVKLNDFTMNITTDFKNIDFENASIVATSREETDKGWKLKWDLKNTITAKKIIVEIPGRLTPAVIATLR